jgi:hypothetical protein
MAAVSQSVNRLPVHEPVTGRPGRRLFRLGRLAALFSLLGLVMLSFVFGAAVVHFELQSFDFLTKAFLGAQAWFAKGKNADRAPLGDMAHAKVTVYKQGQANDGFTLFTTTEEAGATLIDMHGAVVHRWTMPSKRPWVKADDVQDPEPNERLHWERCFLFANGDILALCSGGGGKPYGYGLGKFDKDSQFLWGYSGKVHHDFDVGEDGRIYILTQQTPVEPSSDLDSLPKKYHPEFLVILSPKGQILDSIPILEAFRGSPYYETFLSSGNTPHPGGPHGPLDRSIPRGGPSFPDALPPHLRDGKLPSARPFPGPAVPAQLAPADIIHANSVKVLSRALAKKFPSFKAGQVLLSLRSSSVIALLDVGTRSITWAAKGPWQAQHDAQFLDNGRILLFDNLGFGQASRVMEYDPVTQAVPWSYRGDKGGSFLAPFRGATQRLANGNTLIVDPERRFIEVTKDREIVWERGFRPSPAQHGTTDVPNFTCARRYSPEELTFLQGRANADPR